MIGLEASAHQVPWRRFRGTSLRFLCLLLPGLEAPGILDRDEAVRKVVAQGESPVLPLPECVSGFPLSNVGLDSCVTQRGSGVCSRPRGSLVSCGEGGFVFWAGR